MTRTQRTCGIVFFSITLILSVALGCYSVRGLYKNTDSLAPIMESIWKDKDSNPFWGKRYTIKGIKEGWVHFECDEFKHASTITDFNEMHEPVQ